jgi:hypothetical protein
MTPVNVNPTPLKFTNAPIAPFVSADAFITRELGTTGVIQYGNANIGVAGATAATNGTTP